MNRRVLHIRYEHMGTNVYMRRIPTEAQKEELKRLLKKQYEDSIESIDRDEDLRPAEGDWQLADEIEKTRKRIYEEVHIGKRSCGWKFLFAPSPAHYDETKESILQFIHQDGWQLFDEYGDKIDPDKFWDEYVTCMEDGWTGETYDRWEREQGHYYHSAASYEHVTSAGLRFARDTDFC